MTTIVSAFLGNANSRNDRKTDDYINLGMKLLKVNTPKVIFIDDILIELVQQLLEDPSYNKNNTILIPINRESITLFKYKDSITNFNVNSTYPSKDSLDFMILMCSKTEFMEKAIKINPFNTYQFVWIDFGINHIFNLKSQCIDEDFEQKILNLTTKKYDNIRIGGCIDLILPLVKDIYKDVVWYLAGGVFGGKSESLLKFANLVKEKCNNIILEKKTLMWEVNIWYLVYLENKELFNHYLCGHDEYLIIYY